MFESICWSTLGCHSGSPVLNLCFCVVSEILFCNVCMEHSPCSDTSSHSFKKNAHYFSEVESSVPYSNFEVHCLAFNSFFVFKNTLWFYHALSSVYTGLSEVVLSLGLCVQYCVQDNCIITTEIFFCCLKFYFPCLGVNSLFLSVVWPWYCFPSSLKQWFMYPTLIICTSTFLCFDKILKL